MKHSAMLKFTVLFLVVVAAFLGGCVEVNNPEVSPTDFRSTVRFVNFANVTGATTMSVAIDKSTATTATATFQNGSAYMDVPAGPRFWSFSYGSTTDTLRQALTPYTQYTYYSEYEPTLDASRTYLLVSERRTYAGTVPYPSGAQVVRFINLSSDTAATVSGGLTFTLIHGASDGTSDTSATLGFGNVSVYYQAALSSAPQYMVVGAAGDTLKTATAVGAAAGRYTVVFTGSQAGSGWKETVFTEN
jgi:hypothetical protein